MQGLQQPPYRLSTSLIACVRIATARHHNPNYIHAVTCRQPFFASTSPEISADSPSYQNRTAKYPQLLRLACYRQAATLRLLALALCLRQTEPSQGLSESLSSLLTHPLLALAALVRGTAKGCFLASLPDPQPTITLQSTYSKSSPRPANRATDSDDANRRAVSQVFHLRCAYALLPWTRQGIAPSSAP